MNELKELLEQQLADTMIRATVSNPRKKQISAKWVFRPFLEKTCLMFQQEEYRNNQVFHENMAKDAAVERICALLERDYRQLDLQCSECSFHVLVGKKGNVTIKRHNQSSMKKIDLAHNRKKKYLLDGSETIPFLVDLGIQTRDGKLVDKKRKKLGQINRFLEFVRDVLPQLQKCREAGRPLRIIDFGCGKSYLTFAVYYYLSVQNGFDLDMTGLDLKEDVIRHCSELAVKYGYEGLHFSRGDIRSYEGEGQVDLVISLHACDTATDFALAQAVKWGAKVILSVPCCHHELNRQIANEQLEPLLKHGILKERFAALLTDALRGSLLEQQGYEVQILEFIDMEHTPKNLLIRAVRSGPRAELPEKGQEWERYTQLCDAFHGHGTLEHILTEGSV